MLSTLEIRLANLKTGEERNYTLRRMTLRDKCSLDEWLRRRYVAESIKENGNDATERKRIFATANEMDFLGNSWAVTDQLWLVRFIWQCLDKSPLGFETSLKPILIKSWVTKSKKRGISRTGLC